MSDYTLNGHKLRFLRQLKNVIARGGIIEISLCFLSNFPPRSNLHARGRRLLARLRRAAALTGGLTVVRTFVTAARAPPSNDTNNASFAQVSPFQSILGIILSDIFNHTILPSSFGKDNNRLSILG